MQTQSSAQITAEKLQKLLLAQHKFAAKPNAKTHTACEDAMEEYFLWKLNYPEGARLHRCDCASKLAQV